jgi:ERCC4-type nuclease
MIWIDNAVGSKELKSYFSPYDIPTELTELDYGDFVFYGNGQDGPCSIGIERKTIGFYTTDEGEGRIGTDLPSSIRTNRLSGHQVPGLFNSYQYVFFLIEGIWKAGPNGEVIVPAGKTWIPLTVGRRPMLYREISNYLMTLQLKCGGFLQRTGTPEESVAWLVGLYHWFQKEWEEHDSFKAIYAAPYDPVRARGRRAGLTVRAASPVEIHAAQFPGISKKAYEFGKKFGSLWKMFNAEVGEFEEIEGVGRKGAVKIYDYIRAERKENGA